MFVLVSELPPDLAAPFTPSATNHVHTATQTGNVVQGATMLVEPASPFVNITTWTQYCGQHSEAGRTATVEPPTGTDLYVVIENV